MNIIKKINIQILFAFVAGLLVFNACVDKNDWDVDKSHDRLFRPTNLAVTSITATTGDLSFVSIPGTEYYQFELSADSLLFENIVSTFDTTANAFTLTGLDGNTQYSLRVKAIPTEASKGESEWASIYFKTRAEQIMETVAAGDVASRTVTLRWEAGATVTNIVLNDADGKEVQNVTITAEQMAAGELEVTGLSPETSYEALLMNGTKQRGSASFTTYPDVPDAEYYIRLQAGDVLTQEMFDEITASTVTVTFPAGGFFTFAETLTLPAGVSFNFFGLPGDSKAILNLTQLELGATHDYVKFTNLDISGLVYDATGTPTGGSNSYFINQSGETNTATLEFSNCLLHDFNNTPLRLKDSADKYFGNLNIDNCLVYNIPDSYYVINVSASNHVIDNISITNSTFYNIGRLFLHNKANNNSVLIADCTFDDIVAAGRYFFDYSSSYGPTSGFTMRNCILGSTQDDTAKGIRFNGSPTVTNSYATSDFVLGGATIGGLNSYSGASTDLFADPANGDFSIADELFDGKTSAGDPRWYFQ
ncbi:DUF5123 domain-containing protein [Mangrovibacterium diazotrophicum]|uniref:Uncharacterized protein DUF4957 n=1 Tax=Mangrovibacterium diazotrophicum TaxID=1261403 RepID=A0A419W3C2_9BACT|nr:DUF5123 domain-containing protein [Mangrovibacterium diazotrophicum]RKD89976.1 uncharacterized protein DUF4957 [Mangrovibacterium diazotrophicum]